MKKFTAKKWTLVMCATMGFATMSCTKISGLDGKKKIIRQNRIDKGKTMDPQAQFDEPSSLGVGMVFDSLYEYHYLKRPYQLTPSIAADFPKYSADRLTMTIPLRTDVKFIDDKCFEGGVGRTVTAQDVVFTLKRYADSSVNDQSYGLIDDMIVGLNKFRATTKGKEFGKADYDQEVEGLKALDDHTVQIKLTKPVSVVEYVLGAPVTSIVPRECTQMYGQDFGVHPVGTGPFKITYRNRLGDLKLVKNPNYHMVYPSEGMPGDAEKGLLKNAGKRLPLLDEVYSPVVMEVQPAMLRFLRGYFDWVAMDADSFLRMAKNEGEGKFSLKPEYDKNFDLYSEPDVGTYWIVLNMKDPVVGHNNTKLRKAMALAINRQGFIDDMLNGRGVLIDSLVPVTIAGNHQDSKVKFPNYDVAEAKKLLAEAGYPGGKGLPVIKYTGATGGNTLRQFEYLRRNLAEIGVKIEADFTTYSAYLKRMDEGNFQIAITGWHADYPDAENFLYWLTGPSRAEGENYGSWHNKTYDHLYQKIAGQPDSPARHEIIREMGEEVAKDIPVIPMYAPYRVGVTTHWVSGFKRALMSDRQLQYLDVDPEAQKKGL